MKQMLNGKWRPRKLDELGFVGRGKSRHRPRNAPELYDGPYPFVQTADIMASDFYITSYSKTYSEAGLAQSKLWEPNTLCMTIAGENTAETAILTFHACFPDSVVGFIADPKQADVRFVKYYLDHIKRQIRQVTRGATQDNLSLDKLLSFDIIAPPVQLQRKIASIAAAYDELILNNQRRIGILEEMAQAIYREWFVNFRFPAHEKVKLIDSPLGKIPEGWEVVSLKRITTKIGSGATPRGGKEAYKTRGISLIRSLNIYDNQFEHKDLAFIDDEQAAELDNVTIQKRDILLNITGASVARCCMVPSYLLPARVNQHVAIIRVDTAHADPFFVVNTINSERHKRQILALAQGGATREALTKDTISNYEIVLPTRDVYTRYGAIVGDLFDQREVLQKKNNCLRTTRNLLLPKLISGQLDVEELDIDTGESLTEAEA